MTKRNPSIEAFLCLRYFNAVSCASVSRAFLRALAAPLLSAALIQGKGVWDVPLQTHQQTDRQPCSVCFAPPDRHV